MSAHSKAQMRDEQKEKTKVTRIADGRVDLTDGTQAVHARLAVATPTPPARR